MVIKPAAAKLEFLMNFFPRRFASRSELCCSIATLRGELWQQRQRWWWRHTQYSAILRRCTDTGFAGALLVKASLSGMPAVAAAAAVIVTAIEQPVQSSEIVRWSIVSRS